MVSRTPCDEHLGRDCKEGAGPESPGLLLAAVVLGSCMAFIDGTVVNVALPAIQRSFNSSLAAMQWVVNGYTLMLGALILIGGSLGDHLGRKKVFLAGVVLFAASSILCGVATSAPMLIGARVLQGIGGALLVPGSLAIISAAFPENERSRAIGVWAAFSAISAAIGPILGGWLVDNVSWRGAFFINLPIAVATVLLAWKAVPESQDPKAGPIDWLSGIFAALGLGGLTYGLIQASKTGWTASDVLVALVVGTILVCAFVIRQCRAKAPMAPPDLFRSSTFAGANGLTFLLYGALSGALFFVPFNLIQVQGFSATAAGASFLPFTFLMGGFSRWAGGLVSKFGSKIPLIVGPVLDAVGFALLGVASHHGSYWTTVFPGIAVLGLGMTITVAPLTSTVMGAVPPEKSGIASGINNAVSRVAGLFAIAALSLVMVSVYTGVLNAKLSTVGGSARQEVMATANQLLAARVPVGLSSQIQQQIQTARISGFVAGYRLVMLIAAGLATLSAVIAAFTIDGKPSSKH